MLAETPGTGQSGLDLGGLENDLLVHVKTREFGSGMQLRKDQLGGVGPATEQGYRRRCIAENSSRYEAERKRLPQGQAQKPLRRIIGYNVHELPGGHPDKYPPVADPPRPGRLGTAACPGARLQAAPSGRCSTHLEQLKQVALDGGNVFGELLETVRHATLGQITRTLGEVGGRYRKMV